jgi:hypothetical protein
MYFIFHPNIYDGCYLNKDHTVCKRFKYTKNTIYLKVTFSVSSINDFFFTHPRSLLSKISFQTFSEQFNENLKRRKPSVFKNLLNYNILLIVSIVTLKGTLKHAKMSVKEC